MKKSLLLCASLFSVLSAQDTAVKSLNAFEKVQARCSTSEIDLWDYGFWQTTGRYFLVGIYGAIGGMLGEGVYDIGHNLYTKYKRGYGHRPYYRENGMSYLELGVIGAAAIATAYGLNYLLIKDMKPELVAKLSKQQHKIIGIVATYNTEEAFEILTKQCERDGYTIIGFGYMFENLINKISAILKTFTVMEKYESEEYDELKDHLINVKQKLDALYAMLTATEAWKNARQNQLANISQGQLEEMQTQTALQTTNLALQILSSRR